jgi:hypothetical protein
MAVMERDAWTDERLDRLDQKVDAGFKEMRTEFKTVRGEMREELREMRGELGEIRSEMGALNRTIIQFAFAVVGTIFLGFMGTIAALITLV